MKQYELDPAEKDLSYSKLDKTKYNLPIVNENKAKGQKEGNEMLELFNSMMKKVKKVREQYPESDLRISVIKSYRPEWFREYQDSIVAMTAAMGISDEVELDKAIERHVEIYKRFQEKDSDFGQNYTHFGFYKSENMSRQQGEQNGIDVNQYYIEKYERAIEAAEEKIQEYKRLAKEHQDEIDTSKEELKRLQAALNDVEKDPTIAQKQPTYKFEKEVKVNG